MRPLVVALALLLTACAPPAPPASAPADAPAAAPQLGGPYAAALAGAPESGVWVFRGDEGIISTCFGAPESECQIAFQCEAPSGKITVSTGDEIVPDQATTIRLVTTMQLIDLAARSYNEGLPSVTAAIADGAPEKIPLIGMLGAPTDRFAVEVAGEIGVYPWDESIARVLIACRRGLGASLLPWGENVG